MSAVLENMKSRRSVRKFKPDMVPQEILDQITEAGLYAASGMGRQATIMLQVTNKELRDKIAKMNQEIGGWTRVYDGSLVMGNLMLAAHELGVDSCWIHRAKEEFETEWGKELLKSLGVEEEYEGIGHCALGYADGEYPQAAERKEHRIFKVE